jgi:hypothetical protein
MHGSADLKLHIALQADDLYSTQCNFLSCWPAQVASLCAAQGSLCALMMSSNLQLLEDNRKLRRVNDILQRQLQVPCPCSTLSFWPACLLLLHALT